VIVIIFTSMFLKSIDIKATIVVTLQLNLNSHPNQLHQYQNIVPIKPPEQINIKEVESGKGSIVTDQRYGQYVIYWKSKVTNGIILCSTESNPQVTGNAVADTMDLATKVRFRCCNISTSTNSTLIGGTQIQSRA